MDSRDMFPWISTFSGCFEQISQFFGDSTPDRYFISQLLEVTKNLQQGSRKFTGPQKGHKESALYCQDPFFSWQYERINDK